MSKHILIDLEKSFSSPKQDPEVVPLPVEGYRKALDLSKMLDWTDRVLFSGLGLSKGVPPEKITEFYGNPNITPYHPPKS